VTEGRRTTIREAEKIRRMFGGISSTYDLLNHLLSLNQDRKWRTRTVAAAGVEGPVLDVCCGTGDLAIEWGTSPAVAGPVIAADFCLPMLERAREKEGAEGVRFLAADTLRLPFPPDSFGGVSVAFGIRNVANLSGGIREMVRVARPGGKVVILEFTMPKNPLFRAVYLFYFLLVLPFVGNLLSGAEDSAYGYLPRSVLHFPPREELVRLMEEEGLRDIRAHDLSMGIVNVLVGTKDGAA